MFGQNPIYGQIPDPSALPGMTPEMIAAQAAPTASGGMFGGGKFGIGQAIVAALNGYLASQPGGAGEVGRNNMQMMAAMRQRALEHQQSLEDYNRKRADDRSDFTFQQDYKTAHAGPDDFTQRVQELDGLEPGLGKTYAHNYAQNGGGMGPVIVNPLTGQTMMPAGKAPTQEPPAEAIQRLRSNPAEASQFDEIFGPGTSAKILGGPASQAPGGFPY